MIEVEVPGMGVVEFPDDTHPDVMQQALSRIGKPPPVPDVFKDVPRSGLERAARDQSITGMQSGLIGENVQDVLRVPGMLREFIGSKLVNAPEQVGRNLGLLPRYQPATLGQNPDEIANNGVGYMQKPMLFKQGESMLPGEPGMLKNLVTPGLSTLLTPAAPLAGLSYITDIIASLPDVLKQAQNPAVGPDERNRDLMNQIAMVAAPMALHGVFAKAPVEQPPLAQQPRAATPAEPVVKPPVPPSAGGAAPVIIPTPTPSPAPSTLHPLEQATGFKVAPAFSTEGMPSELVAMMPPQPLHLTDMRPGSPTEGMSVSVPHDADPAAVQKAIEQKVKEGYTGVQEQKPVEKPVESGPVYPMVSQAKGKYIDQAGNAFKVVDGKHVPWTEEAASPKTKEPVAPAVEPINTPLVGEPPKPVAPEERSNFLHALKGIAAPLKWGRENGKLSPEQIDGWKSRAEQIFSDVEAGKKTHAQGQAEAEALRAEILPHNQKPGKLYSGVPGLDPGDKGPLDVAKGLWEKGSLFTTQAVKILGDKFPNAAMPQDTKQTMALLKNKLGTESAEWRMLKEAGIEQALPEKASPKDVADWINKNGPKAEAHSYGMEGKVSEAKKEYDKMTHEMETSEPGLLTLAEMRGRGDTWQEIADEYSQSKGRGQVALSAGRLILGEKAAEVKAKVDQYNNLKTRVAADEASSNNPRATSAYSSVSALPTDEPMPEWTATKSGKNVQRVDVVVPQKRQNENDLISDGGKIDYDAKGKPLEKPLWQPDNLHENLPNTLGWAMIQYKTGPKGEKIAVIAEAQSRWGQQLREDKMSGDVTHPDPTVAAWHKSTKTPDHPLLRDYNRLILKAAIEQARKEGATHIMVSDAETAMMTEGHDVHNGNNIRSYNTEAEAISRQEQMKRDGLEGNITKQGDKWVLQERPSQEPGMRLNYDTILPKIAEELTGSKGEKVSLGEHKNAFRDPNFPIPGEHYLARETRNPVPRSNLIFRNADGTPKTDVSGTMYPLGKAGERLAKGEPMTLTGKLYMGIPGFDPGDLNPVEVAKKVAKAIKETVDPIKELVTGDALKATWARQAGVDAPKTMTASPEAGEALVGFAASKGAGQAIAKSAVTDVLGDKRDDPQFRKQLGAVIYEDMRRAEGRIGNPVTDIANSPFADEAQYRAALKNPEIQAALQRHKDTVQEMARVQHERLGGELAKVGEDTGAFANMIAILDEPRPESKGGPGSGQFNTLTRGSAFSKPRKFSAAEYNFDYRDIGERMIEKNYSEVKKQELYDKLEATGLGKMLKQGDSVPEGFVGVPVQRRQLMITKPGEKPTWVNQNKTLAVRNDVAPEAQQAFQTDSKLVKGLVGHLADLVTKAQVQLGVDAGFHTANDFAGLNGAIRTSIGKNLIGVKEADTLVRMFKNGKRLLDDSPEVQRELAAMAKAGVGIRDNVTQSKALSGRFLRFIDTATRVSMNGLFDDMVKEGWVKDVPAERRRFINGALGQYNPRLMTKLQQIMQQSGASPFIVAGKNFNRLAVQRLMMSPGVKAASPEAFAKMRALQVLSAVSALVILPAAVNYWQTGKPEGRPGTKFGEMNVGKMNVDPAQWMMLRRGMRLTGLQAGIEGMRSGQDLATTGKQALKDVVSARLHPYEGPAVRVAEQLGKTALAGQGLDMKKAVSELNPTIGAGLKALEQGKGKVQGVGEMVGNMVGVKVAPEDRIVLMQEARIIARGHGKPDMVYSPSQYTGLINTLKNNPEKAKSVYEQLVKDEIEADKMEWDVNKKKARVEKLIEQHFKNYPTRTFTGKKEWDEELQKKQPELYQKVRAEDKATADLFFQEVLGQGGVPVNLKQKRFSMKQALEGLK